ncbi:MULTISPECIES: type I-E CRISPR-associated endoribonuclease Cas2e [Meiothermus]|jgi:CRISPR-associated protein Cas2|uniref:CRISPR-associated endoribonuclease Cas2 n=1 Tax=Meiothermus taiwanensis TaxID=172827 RepID=A0A399DVI5_9DEIN|nr:MULTISPECIES: type I-E CRISPR-associated endoribonuclease Cas2e [Meiothermus]RIH76195.1 CRISPR-associated endoribonuclease Cas2 [Meiothermus taiwanensis]GAO76679.1 CRISPR-associated protein Cas2 [Meiothermus ruber H328]
MVVIVLEKVPKTLRGELSRWMLEVSTGVFVGSVSALVRDLLWEKCIAKKSSGRCCLLYRTNNEQGFAIRTHGDTTRTLIDFDGLTLVAVKNAEWERMHHKRSRKSKPGANLDKVTRDSDTSEGSSS